MSWHILHLATIKHDSVTLKSLPISTKNTKNKNYSAKSPQQIGIANIHPHKENKSNFAIVFEESSQAAN
jgi:hypothetical protein